MIPAPLIPGSTFEPPLLETQNLSKSFGGKIAISSLSFALYRGEALGIIGPNGAGKTTLFNLLTGFYEPSEGRIFWQHRPLKKASPAERARQGIVRTFQNVRLFRELSVLDNVRIACHSHHNYSPLAALLRTQKFQQLEKNATEKAFYYLETLKIENLAHHKAGSLPYGSQRKVEIARALALEPQLLLLDEPVAGMNDQETAEMRTLLQKLREKFELSLILIEHHMDFVMELCDSILVLNFGALIAQGSPKKVCHDPEVQAAYLGISR